MDTNAEAERQTSLLITGITGFVGLNLLEYLSDKGGYAISGASRDVANLWDFSNDLTSAVTYDDVIDDKQGVSSFDSYIHLAGKVFDMEKRSTASDYYIANYDLARKLFDRFLADPKATKFIFLSTIHAVTESADRELTEMYHPVPVTPYGVSKMKAEQYMLDNCPPEKSVYILRPSMIHGPGNKGSLNMLYGFISRGYPYPMGAFNNKRSFVSIENLCFIIHEILSQDVKGGLYHVADDSPTYTHDLVKQIAKHSGVKARIWNISPIIVQTLAKIGNWFPFPLNDYRFNKLTGDFIVSNEKIKQAIGKSLPVSAEEGITRTLNSFNGD